MSGRDEWIYDFDAEALANKIAVFSQTFAMVRKNTPPEDLPLEIKWSRNLKRKVGKVPQGELARRDTQTAAFRPFVKKAMSGPRYLLDEVGALEKAFSAPNSLIAFLSVASSQPLAALALDKPFDYGLLKTGNGGTQGLYRYRYSKSRERIDNITDWALNKFVAQYGKKGMSKDAIFAYCYAVLHDPVYREKYALNLKREFPRIPFYPDFAQWVAWGEALMKLHIDYEQVEPFALQRIETPTKRAAATHPKPVLRSNPETGSIMIDADTRLTDIPPQAWEYRLGNRSGIDWVLDQHKEKKPRDPTIAAKFTTYRFADYKEPCIDLLARVVTVSLETVKITQEMANFGRSD
jgi:predicted helicase